MTKDFKLQANSNSSGIGQYGMGWMLGGVAIGLLIGVALYALKGRGGDMAAAQAQTVAPTAVVAPAMTNPSADTSNQSTSLRENAGNGNEEGPGFSYHAVLPQLEVGMPVSVQEAASKSEAKMKPPETPKPAAEKNADKSAEKPAEKPAQQAKKEEHTLEKPAPSTKPTGANGFQLGSYKTSDQANGLMSKLRQKGLNARVESGEVNGAAVYRVRLGPATSQEMLDKWQKSLSGMGISALPVHM